MSANYQKVLSLMKYHNNLLCGAAADNVKKGETMKRKKTKKGSKIPPSASGASLEELKGLLKTLEEEFAGLAL